MPIKFLRKSTNGQHPVDFDFGPYGNVQTYAVGISGFNFAYRHIDGVPGFLVRNIVINCSSNFGNNVVYTSVTAKIADATGVENDPDQTSVVLCCAAVVGEPTDEVGMGNPAHTVPDSQESSLFDLPGSSFSVATGFLSGFRLSYGETPYRVHRVNATAGLSPKGNRGTITSQVGIADSHSHSSTAATIDGGYLATTSSEGHLLYRTKCAQDKDRPDLEVDFGTNLAEDTVGVFMTDFAMVFDQDGETSEFLIHQIGAGVDSWSLDHTGQKVVLKRPGICMTDDEYTQHTANPRDSWVNLTVLAYHG
ncbi:MAG: hypothetical protein ACRDSR_16615 [Pseudonocardiaceae bacterium]